MIASRNPQLARADAATESGLRAIASNPRAWTLTVTSQVAAIFMTVAGLGVLAKAVPADARTGPKVSAVLFTLGAALMLLYLGFHLFITPRPPSDYEAQRRRYARLYRIYMVAAYVAFGVLGLWFVRHHVIASWTGWFLLATGIVGLVTAIVRRPAAADLPLWIHVIAFVLGFVLLSR